jgi:flagellar hook-length control protein FliK
MGSATSMRVDPAPAPKAPAASEGSPAESRDFLSLLGGAVAGRKPEAATSQQEGTDEEPAGLLPDTLAELLPGLFAQPAPAPVPPGGEWDADAVDDLLAGDGAAMLQEAVAETLDADALRDAVLDQITAEISAGNATDAEPMREMLQQLNPLLSGAAGESTAGFRPAAGNELPGLMVQTSAGSSAATVAPASTPPSLEQAMRSAVGSPRWADELGSRLVVMSARGQHEGSLSLTPEHLGPLEVRISLNQNTANVWFGAQHADTRAALTEALPRLRELFEEAGLSLGHSGVSEEAPRRQATDASLQAGHDGDVEASAAARPVVLRHLSSALLDLYA